MGLEDTSAPGELAGPESPPPEEAKVKPLRAAKRERDAMLHRIKRKMPHLSEAKLEALDKASPVELERILDEGLNPRPAPLPVVQVTLEPGQKPGWPPPSAMKEWAQLAHLASIVPPFLLEAGAQKAPRLQHWAQAFAPREIQLGEQRIKFEPQAQLAEALAGLLAKHLGGGPGSSPEAQVAIVFLSVAVFGALDLASTLARESKAAEKGQEAQPS